MNANTSIAKIIVNASIPHSALSSNYNELHDLSMEWYEVNVSSLKRVTDKGLEIQISKSALDVYHQGDIIYDKGGIRIQVHIKPCDSIILTPIDIVETGRICFEIGNQHIPIFLNDHGEIMAAYDGHLYDILEGGNFRMRIEPQTLHPEKMVKAFGNFF